MVQKNKAALRVRQHRRRQAAAGSKRIEVTVPSGDAALLRALSVQLRAGGKSASRARASLHAVLKKNQPSSGADLVAFLRDSPLVGVAFDDLRERSIGRKFEL